MKRSFASVLKVWCEIVSACRMRDEISRPPAHRNFMSKTIYIATRGSALALVQANQILDCCRAAVPERSFELKVMSVQTAVHCSSSETASHNPTLVKIPGGALHRSANLTKKR